MNKFDHDKYFILKLSAPPFGSSYAVADENGQRLFWAREQYFIQTNIEMFDSEGLSTPVLTIKSEGFYRTRFIISDAGQNIVGKIIRKSGVSIKHYEIVNCSGTVIGKVKPSNFSLFRKGSIYFGEKCIGCVQSRTLFSGEYVLDLSNDSAKQFDRKFAVGMGLALCGSGYF